MSPEEDLGKATDADSRPANSTRQTIIASLRAQLNFYRIHVIYFTITPLVFAAIFYASNGDTHVTFINALFNCISAICVCGLATVDLSSLTPWQQTILFMQMCIGSPIVVSWVVVFARRRLFMHQCTEIIERARKSRAPPDAPKSQSRRIFPFLTKSPHTTSSERGSWASRSQAKKDSSMRVRADMIRRVDDAPKLVNPSGWISEGTAANPVLRGHPSPPATPPIQEVEEVDAEKTNDSTNQPSSPDFHGQEHREAKGRPRVTGDRSSAPTRVQSHEYVAMPRTQTIEFAPEPLRPRRGSIAPSIARAPTIQENPERSGQIYRSSSRASSQGRGTTRYPSAYGLSHGPSHFVPDARHSGFGFFASPHHAIGRLVDRISPGLKRTVTRNFTMPRTQTIVPQSAAQAGKGVRLVSYISFDAIVGKNSVFHRLTHEQLEELGGVEYRGLTALLWLIPLYVLGVLIISFTVIAPYMSLVHQWQPIFLPPTQHKPVNPSWFSMFQVVSAFTNTGMSLVDQSMVPFQRAYPMILFLSFLILGGNTAFPIFFRFGIWIMVKIFPERSSLTGTLHFLLDHPRRCYIYLFPSYQTWFLFLVVVCLNLTDWVFFLLLDIGNPEIDALPVGVRMIDGVLQSAAVRSSGFAIVTIALLAPAVRVAYVIMMYISIYPIAMSVRSTNVYEEQSLGIYDEDSSDSEDDDEEMNNADKKRISVWGKYLVTHMRQQLSFDMWWLAVALFLVCIIERGELTSSDPQFDIFTILFELVSAYGGVGLSLGLPSANYSTSGGFRTLSKLVVCAVMLRGRHRGLPVAIDRAVVLPFEFKKDTGDIAQDENEVEMRRSSGWSAAAPGVATGWSTESREGGAKRRI